jgi:hypothetical protein
MSSSADGDEDFDFSADDEGVGAVLGARDELLQDPGTVLRDWQARDVGFGCSGRVEWEQCHVGTDRIVSTDVLHDVLHAGTLALVCGGFVEHLQRCCFGSDRVGVWCRKTNASGVLDKRMLLVQLLGRSHVELNSLALCDQLNHLFGFTILNGRRNT